VNGRCALATTCLAFHPSRLLKTLITLASFCQNGLCYNYELRVQSLQYRTRRASSKARMANLRRDVFAESVVALPISLLSQRHALFFNEAVDG
jgi:hypothetical protein